MSDWLEGQVVLVTGGGSGIGLAVVERFIDEGASIGVLERHADRVAAVQARFGEKVVGITGDVTSLADNERAVADTVARFGKLDTFVGNAGIWDYIVPLAEQPHDQLEKICDEILGVNVKGYLLGARAAIEALRKTSGSMIFTASSSSFYTRGGGPIYVASKHAVVGMIKQLAVEVAPQIRVNGVAPGGTLTPLAGSEAAGMAESKMVDIPDIGDLIASRAPAGFAAQPADHVGVYVLLASSANSRYVTGTVISSDGGSG